MGFLVIFFVIIAFGITGLIWLCVNVWGDFTIKRRLKRMSSDRAEILYEVFSRVDDRLPLGSTSRRGAALAGLIVGAITAFCYFSAVLDWVATSSPGPGLKDDLGTWLIACWPGPVLGLGTGYAFELVGSSLYRRAAYTCLAYGLCGTFTNLLLGYLVVTHEPNGSLMTFIVNGPPLLWSVLLIAWGARLIHQAIQDLGQQLRQVSKPVKS